jgi:thiosulfate/3-mercaptopyruvate sulfurtransferase
VTAAGPAVLVAAEDLAAELAAGRRIVLLDVRWALGDPHGRRRYLDGHLPGAVFVDLETELAAPPSPADGRHPLPPVEKLQAAARRWGVRDGDGVVAYDATGGLAAARAWWLLRWGGLSDVRLLDGGLQAWTASGRDTDTGEVVSEPGDVTLAGGGMPVLTIDEAGDLPSTGGVLLDARSGERYRGETEPVDPRAGHVPGAVTAPTTGNLDSQHRFVTATELSQRFAGLGVRPGVPVGVYCGSGVTAAHEVAALAVAGIEAALWPGSWSQWSADPSRPAATGPEPDGAGR